MCRKINNEEFIFFSYYIKPSLFLPSQKDYELHLVYKYLVNSIIKLTFVV